MKIHSFASIVSIPFLLLTLFFGYHVFYLENSDLFIYLVIFVVISMTIYMFQPQIDFYWFKNHPLELKEKEKKFLRSLSSFYASLNDEQKIKFENRAYVFVRFKGFEWIRSEKKELPQDMRLLIAANAVQITFNLEDYLFDKFDLYFGYNHAFPTPNKQFLHSVEVNMEDKIAIFNMEVIINSQNVNNKIFNIGLFAFAEIFISLHPRKMYPEINKNQFWEEMELVSGISKQKIIDIIGYEPNTLTPVMITIFFMYSQSFKDISPKNYDKLCSIFNIEH